MRSKEFRGFFYIKKLASVEAKLNFCFSRQAKRRALQQNSLLPGYEYNKHILNYLSKNKKNWNLLQKTTLLEFSSFHILKALLTF